MPPSLRLTVLAAVAALLLAAACASNGDVGPSDALSPVSTDVDDVPGPEPDSLGPWRPAGSLRVDDAEVRLMAAQTGDGDWECFGLQTRNGPSEPWTPEIHTVMTGWDLSDAPADPTETAACVPQRVFEQSGVQFFYSNPVLGGLRSIGAKGSGYEEITVEIPGDIAVEPIRTDGRLVAAKTHTEAGVFETLDCERSDSVANCRLLR